MFFCNLYTFYLQIYDLEKGVEDYKNRLKNAAEIRNRIEAAYTVFIDTKTSVQELCSEELRAEMDAEVESILERAVVSDQIDDTLRQG